MSKASIFTKNHLLLLVALLFVANTVYVWWTPAFISMTRDEYIFCRLTLNLPNGNTDADWFVDGVAKEWGYSDPVADLSAPDVVALNQASYTTLIWIHSPVANYLAYPIIKIFTNPFEQIKALHLVCVVIITLTVVLFVDIIRRRTNQLIAALSVFPMFISQWLLLNGIIFYHDTFMWLFFALTMWVIERKPDSKWIILLSVVTVLTKLNAVLLLIPIALFLWYKSKKVGYKVIVPSISAVIVFLILQAIVAEDALFVFHHWSGTLSDLTAAFMVTTIFPNILNYVVSWVLFIYIPVLLVGGFLVIKRRMRSQYPFVALSLLTMVFGFGWAWLGYQVYPIMYASMFMVPVILSLKGEVRNYDGN